MVSVKKKKQMTRAEAANVLSKVIRAYTEEAEQAFSIAIRSLDAWDDLGYELDCMLEADTAMEEETQEQYYSGCVGTERAISELVGDMIERIESGDE